MSAALTDEARHKHELVRRHLLEAITHELGPRQRLPSEPELAARLGVSRPTVRRALDEVVIGHGQRRRRDRRVTRAGARLLRHSGAIRIRARARLLAEITLPAPR